MKKLIFLLILLPFAAMAQTGNAGEEESKFTGYDTKACQRYMLSEMTQPDGELKAVTHGLITPETKTIYLSKQTYLKDINDTTINGIAIKQIDVDSSIDFLQKEVKHNHAAVFYVSHFMFQSPNSEMWVIPIYIKKSLFKTKKEYSDTGCKMKFFFHYDPPRHIYKGTDVSTF